MKQEANVVVEYAVELANRGFPLSLRRLEEHVNEIIRKRIPSFRGVGKNFAARFVEEHHEALSMYWTRPLEGKCGGGVNSTAVDAWFELLEELITCFKIDPDLIYNADETGFQPAGGGRERVIGGRGKSVQHQKRSGSREIITVIVTICADGTSIPPTILFKGRHYLVKWLQDNPLKASIGHSIKGWVNSDIAVCWLQDFDKKTRKKAGSRTRLLLVDGHASHMSREILEYACTNNIEMGCFPSHTTHVLQGLDVVEFGIFKQYWSEHRDQYERDTGLAIQKTNFIRVMSKAYVQAFTPHNIKTAFRKTGVVPFNPSVVTEDLLAPSVETLCRSSLPIRQPSPIQAIVDAVMAKEGSLERQAMQIRDSLASTPYAFLVEDSAITSDEAPVPPLAHSSITPLDPGLESLTTEEPATEREAKLQNALAFMLERDRKREEAERVAIATMVLQDLYCTRLKRQLMGREEKGNEESGRLMEDGMPAVLTDDAFYGRVVDKREKRQQEEDRQQDTANAKEKYRQAMHKWSLEDRERVKKNKLAAEQWKEDVKRWTIERDVARVAGRRVGRKKPIRPARTKAKPRPKLTLPSHESSSGEDSVTEDEGASEEEEESD